MKEAALVSSWDIMQINLDVNRTFRSHTMFWDRYGVRQRALFHVLAAYSVYDTVSVPAPASCPAGGLVLSAGDQRDSRLGPQLHGPEMPGRVSLLQDEQGAGCRPPRGGRACVPQGPRVHRGRPRTRIWTLTDGTTDENPGGEGSHSPEGHQAEVPRRLLPSMAHSRRAPRGPQLTHSKVPWGVLALLPSWDLPGATVRPPTCPQWGGLQTWWVPCSLAQLTEAPPPGLRTGALVWWLQGSVVGPRVLAPELVRVALTCPAPPSGSPLRDPPPGTRAVREQGEPDAHGEGSEGARGARPPWGSGSCRRWATARA
uniref:Uncharacterized protein n=2 Tax=Canis lupus familiaris TaxID=9615 RepID=A0A8I3RRF9_CANLF